MKARHIFIVIMVIFQLSYSSAGAPGSLLDNIESSFNSLRQCYTTTASDDQDQQTKTEGEEEEEEEEPDCD